MITATLGGKPIAFRMTHPVVVNPGWKFGDVIQADDGMRAMVVNQTEFVIWVVVLTNPAPVVGRFVSLTERDIVRDDWHLAPESDD